MMVLFYQIIEKKRVFEVILTFWLVFGQIGNGLPSTLKDAGFQESGDGIKGEEALFWVQIISRYSLGTVGFMSE